MEDTARDPWDELAEIEHEVAALESRRLRVIAKLNEQWPDDSGIPALEVELAHAFGISQHTAMERVRIAVALRDLSHLRRAHARGGLSWDQLRWVTRFVTPEIDEVWSRRAPAMTPNELRLESIRQGRQRREEVDGQHGRRYLCTAWDEEHTSLWMEGRFGAEQGAQVEEALRAAAAKVEGDPDAEDPVAARFADALVHLVTSSGGTQLRPTLVVHADAEVVAGVSDGARHIQETSTGIQLHAQAVRRMACMAKVRVALERGGAMIGLVGASRGPTETLMEALWFRDRHCSFPGCEATLFVEAHHIDHWADGGATTAQNLTLLCARHHRMLHEGGWTIRGRPPDLEFVDRWGRVRSRKVPVQRREPLSRDAQARDDLPVLAGVG